MATNGVHDAAVVDKEDHAARARNPYNYGGNPLAHVATKDSTRQLQAFGGDFQPGLYAPPARKLANPAPLGLSAFALTTFVLSLINLRARNVNEPNLVVGAAFAYGGVIQLAAGLFEMVVGNTFGATALSSYGGFWISFGLILTPSLGIVSSLGGGTSALFLDSFGFFLMGWFIFTFLLLICTLRSTVMFFLLFFTLDLAFMFLGIGYLQHSGGSPNIGCIKAGGVFGILAAFLAWYNALAGMMDSSNSFFVVPVIHFPWSDKGRERRTKVDNSTARANQDVIA
jgi:succinate-acetate transporter protein